MSKISVFCTLYFRNHLSYDLHLWYTKFFVCLSLYLRKHLSYDCNFLCTCVMWWPTSTVFLKIICFSSSSINAKKKLWGVPHLLKYVIFYYSIIALVLIFVIVFEWKKNWVFCYLLLELIKTFLVYLLYVAIQVGSRKTIKWQNWCLLFHDNRNQHCSIVLGY